jgi:hypothetical protein
MAVRDPQAGAVALSEVIFKAGGMAISLANAVATNTEAFSASFEQSRLPGNAIDGQVTTDWVDTAMRDLIITFALPIQADEFCFVTSSQSPETDPVSWMIDASEDCYTGWINVQYEYNYDTPLARMSQTRCFVLLEVVANGGFETGSTVDDYEYTPHVPFWSSIGNAAFIHSGARAYGGLHAVDGYYYVGIQHQCEISQSVPRHVPGRTYRLRFHTANFDSLQAPHLSVILENAMPANEDTARVSEWTNQGTMNLRVTVSTQDFFLHEFFYIALSANDLDHPNHGPAPPPTFLADANAVVTITLRNDSPWGDEEHRMIFLDHVSIAEVSLTTTTTTTRSMTFTTTQPSISMFGLRISGSVEEDGKNQWWLVWGAAACVVVLFIISCIMICICHVCSRGRKEGGNKVAVTINNSNSGREAGGCCSCCGRRRRQQKVLAFDAIEPH